MDIRLAIFYLEHPLALHRDFPDEAELQRTCDQKDHAIEKAKREHSLHWQAYKRESGTAKL